MSYINENFLKLNENYLFSTIAKKVNEFQQKNPEKEIIKLGIGDVTRPIVPKVIEAIHKATEEMVNEKQFKGYGPEHGYEFLRKAIAENEFKDLKISEDEIFISDGAKCDTRKYY